MVQYNFKIEEELKARLEKALDESDAENKSDFLEKMVSAYIVHQTSMVNTDIDLSKYENVNTQTKDAMYNAFKHILTTLDGNFSNAKQEAIYLDEEKKALTDKEEVYRNEILKLKATSSEEIAAIKVETSTLVSEAEEKVEHLSSEFKVLKVAKEELEKEFDNVSKVADQVQFITEENRELRESNRISNTESKSKETELLKQIEENSKELASLKETSFRETVKNENKDAEIKVLKEQLLQQTKSSERNIVALKAEYKEEKDSLSKELIQVRSDLNKSIGKLEILQPLEKEG